MWFSCKGFGRTAGISIITTTPKLYSPGALVTRIPGKKNPQNVGSENPSKKDKHPIKRIDLDRKETSVQIKRHPTIVAVL